MTQDPKEDELFRIQDLKFLQELREASRDELLMLQRNLNFGAPAWQKVAVARALHRME